MMLSKKMLLMRCIVGSFLAAQIQAFSVHVPISSMVGLVGSHRKISHSSHKGLYSSSTEVNDQETTVPIILNGQNIELTPALTEYVNKRIGGILRKLASSGSVRECDVVLSVNKNPKVRICVGFFYRFQLFGIIFQEYIDFKLPFCLTSVFAVPINSKL